MALPAARALRMTRTDLRASRSPRVTRGAIFPHEYGVRNHRRRIVVQAPPPAQVLPKSDEIVRDEDGFVRRRHVTLHTAAVRADAFGLLMRRGRGEADALYAYAANVVALDARTGKARVGHHRRRSVEQAAFGPRGGRTGAGLGRSVLREGVPARLGLTSRQRDDRGDENDRRQRRDKPVPCRQPVHAL